MREWDCDIIKLKGVDRNGGQFLSCSDKCDFCLFTIYLKFVLCHPAFLHQNNSQMWFSEHWSGCFWVSSCQHRSGA